MTYIFVASFIIATMRLSIWGPMMAHDQAVKFAIHHDR